MLKTRPFRFMSHLQLLDLHFNSPFAQMADKAKGVPGLIACGATCTKGLIGLGFSKEGVIRMLILPAAADSGLKEKYQFFPTWIRRVQRKYHPEQRK